MELATSFKTILEVGQKRLELPNGEYLVGRSRDCAIRLDDPFVSRVHLRIQVTPDGVTVEDVGAKNPVQINGQPLLAVSCLADGDEIVVGSARLRVHLQPTCTDLTFEEEDTITLTGEGFGPVLEGDIAGCPSCDAVVSEDVEACPYCGHRLQRRRTQELPVLDVE